MKRIAALLVLLQLMLVPSALAAQDYAGTRTLSVTSWVEEWDPVAERWVRVKEEQESRAAPASVTTITTHIINGTVVSETREEAAKPHLAARYAVPAPLSPRAGAGITYGPFRVIDARRAALVGSTGRHSPKDFDAMLRDHPGIEVLEMIEAPGTQHDIANLELGRRIRAAGLRTHVPNGGSVRSGAVELFLAGATRTMEPGAQFAVHSWLDNYGREPADFAPDAPENRLYLDYYVEMGMSEDRARAFYAMTNSVPHEGALWLRAADMAPWIAPEKAQPGTRYASREVADAPLSILRDAPVALSIPVLPFAEIERRDATAARPLIAYSNLGHFPL
ncbi:alpha/beta hydrolase [Erythrobacter sp. THAF29]|uniref:alpha/beta hydrolase n=1 Tax=Erythrobacter sp. THAF29 TaxID=2587851 RepID=UPI00126986C3|nr:alpha/beta hydrolase [Erythrobacter sp. THAF29]